MRRTLPVMYNTPGCHETAVLYGISDGGPALIMALWVMEQPRGVLRLRSDDHGCIYVEPEAFAPALVMLGEEDKPCLSG